MYWDRGGEYKNSSNPGDFCTLILVRVLVRETPLATVLPVWSKRQYQNGSRLLKSHDPIGRRSKRGPKEDQNSTKTAFLASEQGTVKSAKGFFNTLVRF
jgi:hypothetical protein